MWKSNTKHFSQDKHLLTHSGDHPYQCSQCNKDFHRVGSLENIFWYTLESNQILAVAAASLIHFMILYQLHTQCDNGCLTETEVEVKEEWMESEKSNCENKLSESEV